MCGIIFLLASADEDHPDGSKCRLRLPVFEVQRILPTVLQSLRVKASDEEITHFC